MMTQLNNPLMRQNGLKQGQIGAAATGQYSSPAGTVTPPVTQQGGGAGFQQMQAPSVGAQNVQQGAIGASQLGSVQNIGGLLGMMNGDGKLTEGQNKMLGAAGIGGTIGSAFGPVGSAIGAGVGAGVNAIGSLMGGK